MTPLVISVGLSIATMFVGALYWIRALQDRVAELERLTRHAQFKIEQIEVELQYCDDITAQKIKKANEMQRLAEAMRNVSGTQHFGSLGRYVPPGLF